MLPDMDDRPSKGVELLIGVTVAGLVPRDLPPPPLGVPAGHGPVLRAAVPEAAVDLYRHFLPGEGNVDLATRNPRDLVLHPIPQSYPPQCSPQLHLRGGVTP